MVAGLVPARGGINNRNFDLHPDGQRVAVLKAAEQQMEEKRDHVVFIENFFEELRRSRRWRNADRAARAGYYLLLAR